MDQSIALQLKLIYDLAKIRSQKDIAIVAQLPSLDILQLQDCKLLYFMLSIEDRRDVRQVLIDEASIGNFEYDRG